MKTLWAALPAELLTSLLLSALLAPVVASAGCAGANVEVTAKRSRYALSMSYLVRDNTGVLHDRHSLEKVGELHTSRTRVGIFYSLLTFFPTFDISDDVNAQVAAAGGEAVVGMTVFAQDGCQGLNAAPVLNILPIWPGCVPVLVLGDIVRRRPALTMPAAGPSQNGIAIGPGP